MNIHDWQRANRGAIDLFEKWFKDRYEGQPVKPDKKAQLESWLGCWEVFKPVPARAGNGIHLPGKAWNGKPRCGKAIKRMHYHRTAADAVCDLPKMDGGDFCYKHTKKLEEKQIGEPRYDG